MLGAGVMLKAGAPNAAGRSCRSGPAARVCGGFSASRNAGRGLCRWRGCCVLPAAAGPGALLRALKDELFVLETDRLAGRLSEAEYAEHKAAFDVVLRRALARSEAAPWRV